MNKEAPLFLIVDLFCGAGGVTTGFENAMYVDQNGRLQKACKVVACVNHDSIAIKSHKYNHKKVLHFIEDIRTLRLDRLIKHVRYWQSIFPEAKLILWASLECTNFSKAKGGLPRDADSRTLADHLHRYIEALNPDYIQIENVVEFMSWGPLDENGKPISRKSGSDWMRWRKEICAYGYRDEWREMNSADFGAYTSRNRLFGVFAKSGLPIVWPAPTHSKKGGGNDLFSPLKKWKAVKDVLDFEDEGKSIFDRKTPLSEKTLERIYAGLVKYVAKGDKSFISKYFSGRPMGKVNSVNDPASTVTTFGNQSLVQTTFLAAYYGKGDNVSSVTNPCPTIPTKDRFNLIQPEFFIDKHFGASQNQSIDSPAGTVMPNDKHRLVEVTPYIVPTSYDNGPKSIEDPMPTLLAGRKHHLLINPSWGGNAGSVESPCCVVVASQHKAPLYLVTVEEGNVAIAVYEDDSACMIKIKQFMALYGLVDIKMRMLRVNELKKIQGFPETYYLAGNQTDQKKFIGNSVVPHVVTAWVEELTRYYLQYDEHYQVA